MNGDLSLVDDSDYNSITIVKSKVFTAFNLELQTKSVSSDVKNSLERHGCVKHPQDHLSLTNFLEYSTWHKKCILKKVTHTVGRGFYFKNPDSEIDKFIKRKPNPEYSFTELCKRLMKDKLVLENFYIETLPYNAIKYAYHLPARDIFVEPIHNIKGMTPVIRRYWQIQDNILANVSWPPFDNSIGIHQVIHWKNYNYYTSYYGVADYIPTLKAITSDALVIEYNIKFFDNNAQPDWALIVTGGKLNKQSEQEITKYLRANLKGVKSSHRMLYISVEQPDVKVQLVPLSRIRDVSFSEGRKMNRDEIVAMHGVPPKLLGISTPGSLGSGSETLGSMKSYLEEELIPNQESLEEFLNLHFFLPVFGVNPGIKFNRIDITNAKDDAVIDERYVKMGALSPRQVAEMRGFEYDEEYWSAHKPAAESNVVDDNELKTPLDLAEDMGGV